MTFPLPARHDIEIRAFLIECAYRCVIRLNPHLEAPLRRLAIFWTPHPDKAPLPATTWHNPIYDQALTLIRQEFKRMSS